MTTPQPTYTLTTGVYVDTENDTINTSLEASNPNAPYHEVLAATVHTLLNVMLLADPQDYKALSQKVINDIQETFSDENIQTAINTQNEN